jgi:ribosomal protein S18 acetylase RimI-like enzyme
MILAGYEEAARIGSRLWFLVVHAGRPIGCLLLADQAEQDQLELLYVGLSPSARGKQWGLELVRYGQWQAARAGRNRVVLAVDAANEPATRMYASAGFRIWDQQRMFAKVLRWAGRGTTEPSRYY